MEQAGGSPAHLQASGLERQPGRPAVELQMWGVAVGALEGSAAALEMYRKAVAANPDSIGTYDNLAGNLGAIGDNEEALQVKRDELARLKNGKQRYIPAARIPAKEESIKITIAAMLGAYGDILPGDAQDYRSGVPGNAPQLLLNNLVQDEIGVHAISAAQAELAAAMTDVDPGKLPAGMSLRLARIAIERQDWKAVLPVMDAYNQRVASFPKDKAYAWAWWRRCWASPRRSWATSPLPTTPSPRLCRTAIPA